MAGSLRNRGRRETKRDASVNSESIRDTASSEPSSDLELYAKEVLRSLINDNLPPTPNNYSLYFDRLLEDKSENFRKQIMSMLELEESNDAENTIMLEQSLKQGFTSVKGILNVTASLYKNISLMSKILKKRRDELDESRGDNGASSSVIASLEGDVAKLNAILKKQSGTLKSQYDETAKVVKNVENETIFDNKYGVYNKRYLMTKLEQEIELVREFKHSSSLIMVELSKELIENVNNEKATVLMTRTIARLLLKTSRRSDTVAYYGNGQFAMLLKHTDLESAKKASERLTELVSNSNFFLADREIQLKIAIGITDINPSYSVEETVVSTMDGIEKSYMDRNSDYAVSLKNKS
ncbi:GGDEF domain-containing protein [Sulfurimonas lithotrophica]|uniref:diguanylate cyclase n=1 Tax=Sulfurimonas lithotrophica TaxID=2590022 RepID=A0A5P8NXS9_9BACT|nr:GGDEF domain-containing protein [Sulfurimonas lithotrophica]QFR48241.1 GGDEF domain-containing protein [Sulfurimonas lithotrophica]